MAGPVLRMRHAHAARPCRRSRAMNLTKQQLDQLAGDVFLLKTPAPTRLPKPSNSVGAGSLAAKLDPIFSTAADPKYDARFKDMGIAVVDFTANKAAPKVWLRNGDDAWRIGSTGKLSILLAAVQLRDDVRAVQNSGLLSTPQEYDQLFSMSKFWNRSKNSKINDIAVRGPRISTIFDVDKAKRDGTPINFFGPDPDSPNGTAIFNKLGVDAGVPIEHLHWPAAKNFDFSERLWLTGARSDNIAATSCVSDIGVPYLKAVQRAYGLFDPRHGMDLLLSDGYKSVDTTALVSSRDATKYRNTSHQEMIEVKDVIYSKLTNKFNDNHSVEPGSAAALTAYVIALINDKFPACTTIKKNLAGGPGPTLTCYVALGVGTIARVTTEISKIGIVGTEEGEPDALNCEFAYLETEETGPGARKMQYAIIATGIRSKANADGTAGLSVGNLSQNIGLQVHEALLAP